MKTWVLIFIIRGIESVTSGHVEFTSEETCQWAAAEMKRQIPYTFQGTSALEKSTPTIFCAKR